MARTGVDMEFDAIIVGGGIAGLTAAAFLTKAGYTTLLCEKENNCGGLISSFERDGFVFDGGIRALENSGVLFPMLKQLGLEVEFVKNKISIGIENQVIWIDSKESVQEYQGLLGRLFPNNLKEIVAIITQIREIMHYLDVQYAIDNPVFLDLNKDSSLDVQVCLNFSENQEIIRTGRGLSKTLY
jgi:phytoene dehydrogenase-like protein